jgi:hypothetical protein
VTFRVATTVWSGLGDGTPTTYNIAFGRESRIRIRDEWTNKGIQPKVKPGSPLPIVSILKTPNLFTMRESTFEKLKDLTRFSSLTLGDASKLFIWNAKGKDRMSQESVEENWSSENLAVKTE